MLLIIKYFHQIYQDELQVFQNEAYPEIKVLHNNTNLTQPTTMTCVHDLLQEVKNNL